jgi:microcystin-dependent protein
MGFDFDYNSGAYFAPSITSLSQNNTTATATTGITVATTVSTTGSSGTNANLPPYLGVYFIIKT